jgi:hypothetical protein
MFVMIKRGCLGRLSQRQQRLLEERKMYYAEDVGNGVGIEVVDEDATLEFFIDNKDLDRVHEHKPWAPVREYDWRYRWPHSKC